LSIDPKFPRSLRNLGEIFIERKEFEEAKKYLVVAKDVFDDKDEIESLLSQLN